MTDAAARAEATAPETPRDPDYIFDPDDWEATYCWEDRDVMLDDIELHNRINEIQRISTLIRGPDKFVVHLVKTWDECCGPDETETRWFDTKDEALAAIEKSRATRPE